MYSLDKNVLQFLLSELLKKESKCFQENYRFAYTCAKMCACLKTNQTEKQEIKFLKNKLKSM